MKLHFEKSLPQEESQEDWQVHRDIVATFHLLVAISWRQPPPPARHLIRSDLSAIAYR